MVFSDFHKLNYLMQSCIVNTGHLPEYLYHNADMKHREELVLRSDSKENRGIYTRLEAIGSFMNQGQCKR